MLYVKEIIKIYRWILPESPRWLLAMGKTHQLRETLQRASEFNGKALPENFEKLILPPASSSDDTAGVLDLFRTPKMRKITLLLSIIWFTVYLIYYGLVLNVGNIGGDLYINSVSHHYWAHQKIPILKSLI